MNALPDPVRHLRQRVSELEEENLQLRAMLATDDMTWLRYRKLGLSPTQCRLLAFLMKRDVARIEAEMMALYPDPDERERRIDNNIKVAVHHIRTVLGPHGIRIDTLWRIGHRITPENKARIEALLAAT